MIALPIYKAMQQARNITNALMYLRAAYRQPRSLHNPVDYLARSTMYEWSRPNGDLKENYKLCVELDTYFDMPHNIIYTRWLSRP